MTRCSPPAISGGWCASGAVLRKRPGDRIDDVGRDIVVTEALGNGDRSAHLFEVLATVRAGG